MKKQILSVILGLFILTAFPSFTSFAGEWTQNEAGWRYQDGNGTYTKSGWIEVDGKWYHFDDNGYMESNAWINVSETWYYLDADGACLINTTTPDNYKVGADGARIFEMPATGLPTLVSIQTISASEKYSFINDLYNSDDIFQIDRYTSLIPNDLNTIVEDTVYYAAVCDHVQRFLNKSSFSELMISNNPALRISGYYLEECRQTYLNYLPVLSKDLKNNKLAKYAEDINNMNKAISQIEQRYKPYIDELSSWYYYGYDYNYEYNYNY